VQVCVAGFGCGGRFRVHGTVGVVAWERGLRGGSHSWNGAYRCGGHAGGGGGDGRQAVVVVVGLGGHGEQDGFGGIDRFAPELKVEVGEVSRVFVHIGVADDEFPGADARFAPGAR